MGGVISLGIVLNSNVTAFRALGGSVKLTIAEGVNMLNIYFSYKSANIVVEPIGNGMYNVKISWRTPNDRPALLAAIQSYINQKVLIIATFSTWEQKVFGSKVCPMVLTYNPTPQGVPQDYNGLEFLCSGADFVPGRFLTT